MIQARNLFHSALACCVMLLTPSLTLAQDASNVTLVGNFGKGEGESKAVFAAGSLVYYGIGNKLQIASFSDPANPLKVASVPLSDVIEDVVRTSISSTQHLVVVGGPKLWLINVQNPTTPSVASTVNIGSTCEGVATSGTFAYVAAGGMGLQIYNIANPASPSLVVGIDSLEYCESVVISQPYAYIAAGSRSHIVNISDPANPTYAGQIPLLAGGYHQYLNVRSGHAYVCDFNSGLQIVDVTNPASPANVNFVPTGFRTARIVFDGNYGYVANGDSGVRILDVSNIAAPVPVGIYDTPGRSASVYFGAITISGTPTGHIYSADRNGGLRAINVSTPNAPSESGALPVLAAAAGTAFGAFFDNNKVYVAYGSAGLRIIDVSTPSNPTLLGTVDTPGDARAVVASGNYAYVADRSGGVRVIDVSNPANPVEVTSVATPTARGIAISGNYVYVAASDSGLVVLDISNPASPVRIVSRPALYGENVAASGNVAAITDYDKIGFYDVTNPAAPVAGGNTPDFSTGNEGFAINGIYAYIPDGDVLRIFDISTLATPTEVGSVTVGGYGYTAAVSGNYAYVAAEGAGVRVIDVSNPAAPVEVGYYDGVAEARGVAANGAYVYVAERTDGLSVYTNDFITSIDDEVNPTPLNFTLQQNYPNPFNPVTTISFTLPRTGQVKLEVYSILGERVATILSEVRNAGTHTVAFDANRLASGVYLYRLQADAFHDVRKMLLMK